MAMGSSSYPNMAGVHDVAGPPGVQQYPNRDQYNGPSAPRESSTPGYPRMDPNAALELEKERMRLEYMRLDAERREREDRLEEQRRREAFEREREAARQHAMNLQAQAAQTAPVTTVYTVADTEKYCGPISWIIGIFLFPCICCCPVDTRPVVVATTTPSVVSPASHPGTVSGVPIYNAAPGVAVMK